VLFSRIICLALLPVLSSLSAHARELSDLDGGIEPSRHSEDATVRGKYVLHAAGCITCHTADRVDAVPLAGGRSLPTGFGTFYSPNITPDEETGIGAWSLEDFERALREGHAPDGTYYYPSFPYTSYAGMRDEDVADLFAYLQVVEPVRQETREHELGFPYRLRSLLTPWRWMYFDSEGDVPYREGEDSWNRGAYLVNALGHCGECHTPRNMFGGLRQSRHLAGNPGSSRMAGAPDITQSGPVGNWTRNQLLAFLQYGFYPNNDVAGAGMAAVIFDSLSALEEADLEAMVDYLLSLE
jgi:mono/diheme cytochrome c family protein